MNRDFKGIWIPREIWLHPELLPLEKLLWAEVHSLYDREKKGCYASNEYLAEFFSVSERYIREMLNKLKGLGFVKQVSFDGRQRVIMAVLPPEDFEECQAEVNCSSPKGGTVVPPLPEPQFRQGTPHSLYTDNKDENKDKKSISQTAQTATPLREKKNEITFSFEVNDFLNISDQDLKDWKEVYSTVDIAIEIKEMRQWILSNPSKVKSRTLWRKFITGWLKKSHEKMSARQAYQSAREKSSISRHTGFQKDNRPSHPSRIKDYSQWKPDGTTS